MQSKKRIVLIGSGLNGLSLAYTLSKLKIDVKILEASSRLGGRIQTVKGKMETPLELGATWFSDLHQNLLLLLEELGLKKYPQFSKGKSLFQTNSFEPSQEFYVPESESPSYRIIGGTQKLIEKLSQHITNASIHFSTKVSFIKEIENEILIETTEGQKLHADLVVVCIPPQLAASQIRFSPELPDNVSQILPTVQTWMSGSIKFVLEYDKPFWRNDGYSGMLYSHSGIVTEMYDHSNFEETKFGFTGFLNSGASSHSQKVREELVLQQLAQLFGNEMLNPITYTDKIWTDEFVFSGTEVIQRPHQNNGHPLLQESYMKGKLFFSGTEIATSFSGYMEGAIISALKMADMIKHH
jgi:monoamine oxidase